MRKVGAQFDAPPVANPPEFGRPHTAPRIVERRAAYAVIADDAGHVLAVRTERGLFLPGGGVEPGETPAQGLEREIGEELCFALARFSTSRRTASPTG
jgi:8-oxo-dGTP pyrophosphatase MutT (NUDIX family)